MSYTITWNENHCLVEFSGDINISDIELANKYCHGDKRLYKLTASIWDFTRCTSINVESGELHYITIVDLGSTEDLKDHKVALIINDPAATKVLKEYPTDSKKYGNPWKISIFSSLEGAEDWLFAKQMV